MKKDNNCIFCKIIAGDLPSQKIYEDDDFLAFLDISPNTKGHSLLIPKSHQQWWLDLSDKDLTKTFVKAKLISLAIKKSMKADYIRLNIVGTDVPHFHIHLIPLKYGDEKNLNNKISYLDNEALATTAKIKSNL